MVRQGLGRGIYIMMVGMLGMNLIRWRRLDDRENWRNEDRMTDRGQ